MDWKVDYGFVCSARSRKGFGAVKAGRFDLALKALGGVWSACGVLWAVAAGVRQMGGSVGIICLLPAA